MVLKKQDTIGIFSPSTPITKLCPNRTKRAISFLEHMGYNIKLGSLSGKGDYYRSGNIQERADEFNQLMYDPSVNCIMSSIGGMNSNSIVPYIDYNYFKKNPKIVIGHSDVSAILLALFSKTGQPTFYGPAMVSTFGEYLPYPQVSLQYMEDLLSEKLVLPLSLNMPTMWTEEFIDWESQDRAKIGIKNNWICVQPGTATGRLIIGNLDTIYGIWGSEFMPNINKGDILFIEESLKDVADVERGFAFLECNKIFDRIGGLILGKYEAFNDKETGRKPYEILCEIIKNKKIPILADVDCSHTHPMFTLPIGAEIKLDSVNKQIVINSINS